MGRSIALAAVALVAASFARSLPAAPLRPDFEQPGWVADPHDEFFSLRVLAVPGSDSQRVSAAASGGNGRIQVVVASRQRRTCSWACSVDPDPQAEGIHQGFAPPAPPMSVAAVTGQPTEWIAPRGSL